jgi:hypothetical protein
MSILMSGQLLLSLQVPVGDHASVKNASRIRIPTLMANSRSVWDARIAELSQRSKGMYITMNYVSLASLT